jgi:hypothetical protein
MSCEEILVEVTARRIEAGPEAAPALSAEIEEHLAACAACREEAAALGALWGNLALLEAEPPEAELRERFDALLAAYQAGLAASRPEAGAGVDPTGAPVRRAGAAEGTERFRWWRGWLSPSPSEGGWRFPSPALQLSYAVLALVAGVALGALLVGRGSTTSGRGAGPGDVQALRGEVRALNQLVTLSLLDASSASERLQGVSYGSRLERPDRDVVSALVHAATADPNVNVRLAAIEALAPVASQARVLSPLVEALPRQESPMVQVALIDLLLASDGETARRACAELLEDPSVNPDVQRHVRQRLSAL